VLERQDVHALAGPWHPILRAYALAIGVMRELPETDHRSLAYQASVHGVGEPEDLPPDALRSQCQHNCWYFLPWHRWYLYHFEQIVRSVIADIDEVPHAVADAWALPYWNYAGDDSDTIPLEFAARRLWDDQRENPLRDETRWGNVNARIAAVDRKVAAPLAGVLALSFSSEFDDVPTFGGTESDWHHFREPGAVAGGVESTPHNTVHGFVGGNMGDFSTAGLDPLFWLHHSNIDRYWEIKGHAQDPTGRWTEVFSFRDATGNIQEVNSDGCVETENQLGYRYDDIAPPEGIVAEEIPAPPPPDLPPEVIGTAGPVRLEGAPVRVQLEAGAVSEGFQAARGGDDQPARFFLTATGIRGTVDPGIAYGVHLDGDDDEHLAGIVSFFGIRGTVGGAHGLGYTFDVTGIVRARRDDGLWDPRDVDVLFVPIGADAIGGLEAAAAGPPVEVGSVSLLAQ
jgi:tyrosinase